MSITGRDLIEWGYVPGAWFGAGISAANKAIASGDDPHAAIRAVSPPPCVTIRFRIDDSTQKGYVLNHTIGNIPDPQAAP